MYLFLFNCFCAICIEVIATIYGGYDAGTLLIKQLSIFIVVSENIEKKGVIEMKIHSDTIDRETNVTTTQQKKGYCQLLKYLFDIATIGIVSQKNCIFATDRDHSFKNK